MNFECCEANLFLIDIEDFEQIVQVVSMTSTGAFSSAQYHLQVFIAGLVQHTRRSLEERPRVTCGIPDRVHVERVTQCVCEVPVSHGQILN